MAIAFRPAFNTELEYRDHVFEMISDTEGFVSGVYFDTRDLPTIALGFNLNEFANRNFIYTQFGFSEIGNRTATENQYIGELEAILSTNITMYSGNPTALQQALNGVMQRAHVDIPAVRETFTAQPTESRALFNEVIDDYETRVTDWANNVNDPATNLPLVIPDNTPERAVLLSLSWNGVLNVSSSLRDAIANDDRAKAWVEIRYRTNRLASLQVGILNNATQTELDAIAEGEDRGIQKRRFHEADSLGPYRDPDNVTQSEAINIYQAFTKERDRIFKYENSYGGGQPDVSNQILLANQHYGLPTNAEVRSLEENLRPAFEQIATSFSPGLRETISLFDVQYGSAESETLNGQRRDGFVLNAQGGTYRNDALFGLGGDDTLDGGRESDYLDGGFGIDTLRGAEGNDFLYGGADQDTLQGGTGTDLLSGGAGADTYIYNAGDGRDEIIDEDGINILEIDGRIVHEIRQVGVTNIYEEYDANGVLVPGISYALTDGDMHITFDGRPADSIIIRDWGQGGSQFTVGQVSFDPQEFVDAFSQAAANGGLITENSVTTTEQSRQNDDPLFPSIHIQTSDISNFNASGQYVFDAANHDLYSDVGLANYDFWYRVARNVDAQQLIYGRDFNTGVDLLFGVAGNDTIFGRGGNDYIVGNRLADEGEFGDDADYLDGGDGQDVILGDALESYNIYLGRYQRFDYAQQQLVDLDFLSELSLESHGDDIINGGQNSGLIVGDLLSGGGGDDIITSGDATSYNLLLGGAGNDKIDGGESVDRIFGDNDSVMVSEDTRNEISYQPFEFESLWSTPAYDQYVTNHIFNGFLDSRRSGEHYSDSIYAGSGADFVEGGFDGDFIYGEDGNDLLIGDRFNDERMYSEEESLLFSTINSVFHASDCIDGGAGNDQIFGNGAADVLNGGAGDDIIFGDDIPTELEFHGDDDISGGDGHDDLYGASGNDQISGGSGNDFLYGDELTDITFNSSTLSGNYDAAYHGNDTLTGGDGNDSLFGNGGQDVLAGGSGDDVFFFSSGDGQDTILNDGAASDIDQITFDNTVNASSVSLGRYVNDLVISYGSGDRIIVEDAFTSGGVYQSSVLTIAFSAGPSLGISDFESASTISINLFPIVPVPQDERYGTSIDDLAYEISQSERRGGSTFVSAGNAQNGSVTIDPITNELSFTPSANYVGPASFDVNLTDAQGNAFTKSIELFFGEVYLTLDGSASDDTLSGGVSADLIDAKAGHDTVFAGSGNDKLLGNNGDDTLFGQVGNDILIGGLGNDVLSGGSGSDLYIYALGDGNDVIHNIDLTVDRDDRLIMDSIESTDVSISKDGSNLIITTSSNSETITITDYFSTFVGHGASLNMIQFSDNVSWQVQDVLNILATPPPIYGTPGYDEIYGTENNDVIYAGGSYDVVFAMEGNDTVYGEGDDDYISGGDGDDIIYGNEGYDALEGDAGNDQIFGGDDDDYINGLDGNDVLDGGDGVDDIYGGLGDDILYGGTGPVDYLMGEEGNDTYLISLDSGSVEINNYNYGSTSDSDVIKFLEGIDPTDVSVSRDGADILLDRVGSTEVVRILDFYVNQTSTDINTQISVEFSDLTIWDTNQLNEFIYPPMQNMSSFAGWSQSELQEFEEFTEHGFSKKGTGSGFDAVESKSTGNSSSMHLNNQLHQLISAIAAFDVPNGVGDIRLLDHLEHAAPILTSGIDSKAGWT